MPRNPGFCGLYRKPLIDTHMAIKTSNRVEYWILNDREHSDDAEDNLEYLIKFLHDKLTDEQIEQLHVISITNERELLNGLNLAIKRAEYKKDTVGDKQVNALIGWNRLGGRPRKKR